MGSCFQRHRFRVAGKGRAMIDFRKTPTFGIGNEGPFTDEMVGHMVKVVLTHEGIRKFGEEMAEALAQAALASQQALGHAPEYAVDQWLRVIGQRAHELIRE